MNSFRREFLKLAGTGMAGLPQLDCWRFQALTQTCP